MKSTPWPRSLRSPLWPFLGMALLGAGASLFGPIPGLTAWCVGIAGGSILFRRLRIAALGLAMAWGNWHMNSACTPGLPTDWSGTGCFVCEMTLPAEASPWGWQGVARCRMSGIERIWRVEGRGEAPNCIGTFEAWAKSQPWRLSGTFDERAVYGRRGWSGRLILLAPPVWMEARLPQPSALHRGINRAQSALKSQLLLQLEPPVVGFLWGIATGDKSELPPQLRTAFSRAGLAHVLAVSGYHVGLVGFLPLLFARSKRQSLRLLSLLGIPAIGAYVVFCGASESAVRAWTMAAFLLLASVLRRPMTLGHALCLAGWLMLMFHPIGLRQMGTQLSFIAVLGIALGLEAAATWRWPRIGRALVVPASAQSATSPIAVPTFQQFPLAFLPVNLVAGPWVTAIGALFMGWLIWPWEGATRDALTFALNAVVSALLKAVLWVSDQELLVLPVANDDGVRWAALGLGGLAFLVGTFRSPKWWWLGGWAWGMAAWFGPHPAPEPDWTMHRAREPDLQIGTVRWRALEDKESAAADFDGIAVTSGLNSSPQGWVQSSQRGDVVCWTGLQAGLNWEFRYQPQSGLGILEIGGHQWVWERWHVSISGRWH